MAMTNQQQTEAYQFFIIAFGAAPGVEYMSQINDAYSAGMTTKQIVNVYSTKPQFTSAYPEFFSSAQFANALINNVVGASATDAAKAEAKADVEAALNAGWTRGDVVYQIFTNLAAKDPADAQWGNTSKMLANKVAVSQYITEVQLNGTTDLAALKGLLAGVTASSDVSTPAKIEAIIGGSTGGGGTSLTVGMDNIFGTTGGQTYKAPIVQNQNGAVTNTLESGDVIAAVGTGNTLKADLALTISGTQTQGPAISAATNNIQVVELRAQTGNTDGNAGNGFPPHGNKSHIDAENFNGVQQWWTTNSRASIQIEDVRTRPEDTTIGMRNTDPEVGFRVYFDPEQLTNNSRTKDSALTLTLDDILKPGDLTDVPVDGVSFKLDGVLHALKSEAIGKAKTHAELLTALQAQIAADPALAGITAKLNANNTITIEDPAGKAFTPGAWAFIDGVVPADGNIVFQQKVGNPVLVNQLITTNVELDNVGRTSAGGALDIGSLGNGGVEKFEVEVDRGSWLTSMRSMDHLGESGGVNAGVQHQFLQEVTLNNKGANGNLKVGNIVAAAADGRLENGLTDVRVVDGSAFKGNLNLGINLTAAAGDGSVARYLNKSTKPVEFNYTGGEGADLLNIGVVAGVADHKNFVMNVNSGAGDDRVVLTTGGRLNTTSVDGGTGENTFVINGNVGVATGADVGKDVFKSFKNFQNYEIEGGSHDFTGLTGVKNVLIADTTAGASNILRNLPAELSTVTVTGKNQTAGAGNANNAQTFGTLDFQAAKGAELTVKLDNTALVDGKLTVAKLLVQDDVTKPATNLSAVRTLNVVSTGIDSALTSNVVTSIDAVKVNKFNFSGDHALTAKIDAASGVPLTGAVVAAQVTDLKVDGSAMTGNLTVGVSTKVANAVDSNMTASYKGGESAKDKLVFDAGVFTTAKTSVSGFETVAFSDGQFNAVNTTGVTLYESKADTAGDLTLIGLQGTEKVVVGSWDPVTPLGTNGGGAQVFKTNTVSNASTLDITFKNAAAAQQELTIDGFKTVNLKLDVVSNALNLKAFDLDMENVKVTVGANDSVTKTTLAQTLTDIDANALITDKITAKAAAINSATDKLVVTGGVGQGFDSLDLNTLAPSIKLLDVSGYKGAVTATLGEALGNGGVAGTTLVTTGNTTVKVGAYAINITDAAHNVAVGDIAHSTTFQFTTDAVKINGAVQKWTIDDFQVKDATHSLGNISVLDFTAMGIQTGELTFTAAGADTVIKSNGALNFEVVLVGVAPGALTGDNIKYAG